MVEFLRAAIDAVQRNLAALTLYAAAATLMRLADHSLYWFALNPMGMDAKAYTTGPAGIAVAVALFALVAAPHTVAFSWMGRDIDRPLWRVKDDWEALKRFYLLWLILDLMPLAIVRLSDPRVYGVESNGLAILGLFGFITLSVMAIPVGGCLMFSGHVHWHQLGEILAPLARQPAKTGVVIGIGSVQCLLYLTIATALQGSDADFSPPFAHIGLDVAWTLIGSYLDCLVFAGVWLLCMTDRENPDDFDAEF
jgi:hypothetical protein